MTDKLGPYSARKRGTGRTSLGPPSITEESRSSILRALALICLADGLIQPEEISELANAYASITGDEATLDQVRRAVDLAAADDRPVWDALSAQAGDLDAEGKSAILASALAIALSDASLEEAERDHILSYGRALGLADDEVERLFPPEGVVPPRNEAFW